jgi:serine/threonine protein kinase
MGVVYRCRDERLDRDVAVKMMRPGFSLERFQREARLLAKIRSTHVVRVFDFELASHGQAIIYLEWIDGQDLSAVIRNSQEPIDEDTGRRWMREVGEGMLAAAEMGIIHRDLKPSNILIDSRGRAHVADFGLASSTAAPDDLTGTGGMLGTPFYMAPEQAEDPRRIDTRADIYSFGATFYHVLTGTPPFSGPTSFVVQYKHKMDPLISPQSIRQDLSQHTTELLERCLAKHPQERFQSFAELLDYLQPEHASHSPWEWRHDALLDPFLRRFADRRDAYLNADSLTESEDTYDLPGERVLRIVRGNIALQEVDAIVSSDDEWLTMGGGVSYELARQGGSSVTEEVGRYERVRPGRAVVTGAGKLKARYLLHGVTL